TAPKSGKYDVFKVPAGTIDDWVKVFTDPEELRSKVLVDAGAQQIDAIDIEDAGSKSLLELRKDGFDWKLYRGATATKVDDKAVQDLINELTKRDAIAAFVDKKQEKPREYLGVDRPDVVTVRVYADSLGKPDEKKPGKPTPKPDKLAATIKFGLKRDAG